MGSEDRFYWRLERWQHAHRLLPRVRHHAWWLVHNCASHPVLALRVSQRTLWFHDWTAKHLNQRVELRPSPWPNIPSRRLWVLHNVLAHVAIGLVPVRSSFAFHDASARAMDVPGWV